MIYNVQKTVKVRLGVQGPPGPSAYKYEIKGSWVGAVSAPDPDPVMFGYFQTRVASSLSAITVELQEAADADVQIVMVKDARSTPVQVAIATLPLGERFAPTTIVPVTIPTDTWVAFYAATAGSEFVGNNLSVTAYMSKADNTSVHTSILSGRCRFKNVDDPDSPKELVWQGDGFTAIPWEE